MVLALLNIISVLMCPSGSSVSEPNGCEGPAWFQDPESPKRLNFCRNRVPFNILRTSPKQPQHSSETYLNFLCAFLRTSSRLFVIPPYVLHTQCQRSLPRTQFRPNASKGRFDFRKPQTCEQCRAEGKHPTFGPKRRRPT